MTNRKQPKPLRDWTNRDTAIMQFLAQQWCADVTSVRLVLNLGRAQTYQLVKQWRDDFKVIESQSIHPSGRAHDPATTVVWVRPSRVTTYLGWKPNKPWSPRIEQLDHKIQVARVRAALCGLDSGSWISERQLYRDAWRAAGMHPQMSGPVFSSDAMGELVSDHHRDGYRRAGHVHDGRYRDPSGRWWSVEVELTLKQPPKRLATAVSSAYRALPEGDGLLYLYGTEQIGRALYRAVTGLVEAGDLPARPRIWAVPLDKVIAHRTIQPPDGIEAAS